MKQECDKSIDYSETPNPGPQKIGPKNARTNKFPEFRKKFQTRMCVIRFPDQHSPGVFAKETVSRWSGVGSTTVHTWIRCQTLNPRIPNLGHIPVLHTTLWLNWLDGKQGLSSTPQRSYMKNSRGYEKAWQLLNIRFNENNRLALVVTVFKSSVWLARPVQSSRVWNVSNFWIHSN